MKCKEINTPGKLLQQRQKNLETKKLLGEKVERSYAVQLKFVRLSFSDTDVNPKFKGHDQL